MPKDDALHAMRENYKLGELEISSADASPFLQFNNWFADARNAGIQEPNAMVLSTVADTGRPSSRVVLLKEFTDRGFVFFTNYYSRKGRELSKNNFACINFWWPVLERQVRIEGSIEKISEEESDAYFSSRPPESQAGAIVSPQSEVISSRQWLEEKYLHVQSSHNLQRPAHWGGYILTADVFEFWQGRPGRLHDRLQYVKTETGSWKIQRLAP